MFPGRKMKAVTFSYDDAVTQDQRLITLFNRYGLKATFNLNSDLLGQPGSLLREDVTVAHVKPRPCEIARIYRGHEVAAHTLTHPFLPNESDEEIIRQVEQDRLALSDIVGYEVKGFAYPGGGVNFNEHVADIIRHNTGVKYCRTTVSTLNFDLQDDLFVFKPTVYHHQQWDEMERLADKLITMQPDKPQLFYIWGHAYEFDIHNDWDRFERFLQKIAGHDDIFYGTNNEVFGV